MSINSVTVSGNIGRAPELKVTQQGTPILHFSMCVNRRRKKPGTSGDSKDDWEDEANWVPVVIFGNRARGVAPYLGKGTHLTVKGRLHQNSWKDKDTGKNRSMLELVCEDIDFAGNGRQQQETQQADDGAYEGDVYDQDIPL